MKRTASEWARLESGLGERLRQARRALGMTQEAFARRAGTTQAVINKVETGNSRRPRILIELAMAARVSPVWLQWGVRHEGR